MLLRVLPQGRKTSGRAPGPDSLYNSVSGCGTARAKPSVRKKGAEMTLAEIIRIADDIAPPRLAMERDPIGLHAGDPAQAVSKVAVCLDLTMRVLHEVQRLGAQAVLTHHPVVYTPITSVAETSPQGRLLAEAVRSRIAVYALHTNWDAAPDGMNDALASALGLQHISPRSIPAEKFCKIVVFIDKAAGPLFRADPRRRGRGALSAAAWLQKRVLSVLGDLPLRCVGDAGRMVKKVAVCGGAGGDLVQRAASLGADVYITGDVRRHEFVLAEGLGLAVIDATHDAPETFGMKHFAKRFAAKLPPGIEIVFVE